MPLTAIVAATELPALLVSLVVVQFAPPSVDFFMNISLLPYVSSCHTTYRAEGINSAVTVLSEFMFISQVLPVTLSHPVHPVNFEPVSGAGERVTIVPEV